MNKKELMIEEHTLVKTSEYRRLLKVEKHLMSIREGKDYNWLMDEFDKVDSFVDDMVVVNFDEGGEE
jgi:hypothetical protein